MSEAQKPGLSSDSLYYIRNYYLKSTAYYDEKSLFATDKTPLNFRWIGYIVNVSRQNIWGQLALIPKGDF